MKITETILNPLFIAKNRLKKQIMAHKSYLSGVILDVGCGNKPYKEILDVDEYIGIDLPKDGAVNKKEVDVYGSALALPFENASFDGVICTQVLEHLPEPFVFFKEISRVLKKGGYLVLSAPQVWGEHETPHDYYRFTRYGLEYLASSAYLEVVNITPTSGVWAMCGQRISSFLYYSLGHKKNILLKSVVCLICAVVQAVALGMDLVCGGRGDTLDNVLVARKI